MSKLAPVFCAPTKAPPSPPQGPFTTSKTWRILGAPAEWLIRRGFGGFLCRA